MGKGDRSVGLTTLPSSCADCLEIWEPQLPGTLTACPVLQWEYFALKDKTVLFNCRADSYRFKAMFTSHDSADHREGFREK